jgi:4-pyridoxate dehydrogenase
VTRKAYDYIVVGSGSSGATLTGRLSENRDASVLLLEAGKWDRGFLMRIPMLWARNAFARTHDWGYDSEPVPTLESRSLALFRGKVIGGSSTINAMTYARGHRDDFDRWASYGLPEWSYSNVLPYFRKSETWEGGDDAYRGGSGALRTSLSRSTDPLGEAMIAAGVEAGLPEASDYNGKDQEGLGVAQLTVAAGRRCSAADAFLAPALDRSNLDVVVEAHVTRIDVRGNRAVAVEFVKHGRLQRVECAGEIIVCGGAINSPQILMLSGIGDPNDLAAHGIPVSVPSPFVGKNLQEHVMVDVAYERRSPGHLHKEMRLDRTIAGVLRAYALGSGPFTSVPNHILGHIRVAPDARTPDFQLAFRMGPSYARPYLPFVGNAYKDGFGCRPVLMRPKSRGQVALRSADPMAAPLIELNLLQSDHDRRQMRSAIRIVREIMLRPALRDFIAKETSFGTPTVSDPELDRHIDHNAMSYVHPLGTCKMGSDRDETAVVDPQLRVRGVDGLRVVDTSVMPDHICANLNAPAIMIAEKAADMIAGRVPLPAAQSIGSHSI